jgi:hypothetical protein
MCMNEKAQSKGSNRDGVRVLRRNRSVAIYLGEKAPMEDSSGAIQSGLPALGSPPTDHHCSRSVADEALSEGFSRVVRDGVQVRKPHWLSTSLQFTNQVIKSPPTPLEMTNLHRRLNQACASTRKRRRRAPFEMEFKFSGHRRQTTVALLSHHQSRRGSDDGRLRWSY